MNSACKTIGQLQPNGIRRVRTNPKPLTRSNEYNQMPYCEPIVQLMLKVISHQRRWYSAHKSPCDQFWPRDGRANHDRIGTICEGTSNFFRMPDSTFQNNRHTTFLNERTQEVEARPGVGGKLRFFSVAVESSRDKIGPGLDSQ